MQIYQIHGQRGWGWGAFIYGQLWSNSHYYMSVVSSFKNPLLWTKCKPKSSGKDTFSPPPHINLNILKLGQQINSRYMVSPINCSKYQNVTHNKPSSAEEKHYSKNVDHACGEDTIPGAEQDRLPHKQFCLPPWLNVHRRALHRNTKPHRLRNTVKLQTKNCTFPCC